MVLVTTKRKVLWDKDLAVTEPEPVVQTPAPLPTPEVVPVVQDQQHVVAVQPKRAYKQRTGNGHESTKTRSLYNTERDSMRAFFLDKGGMIDNDDCVTFKLKALPADVSIFQVTGFISVLHAEVAEGRTQVKDLVAYEAWMRAKYSNLWARYNHPMYVQIRKINNVLVSQGKQPTAKVSDGQKVNVWLKPKFVAFPKKTFGN